ncbi:uncharacterized protein [Porites lutea]|uniref:uncharacterized protein n=1 Tax=Porites lutea TaxID=51062 RepID=UPI003CC55DF3
MKSVFPLPMLAITAVMITSVTSRDMSSHRSYRELRARNFKAKANFDRPARWEEVSCEECYPGCLKALERDEVEGDHVKLCKQECKCPEKRGLDVYFDKASMDARKEDFERLAQMNDWEEVCRECFVDCYDLLPSITGFLINFCAKNCKCDKLSTYPKDLQFCGGCFPAPDGCYMPNKDRKDNSAQEAIPLCLNECQCI